MNDPAVLLTFASTTVAALSITSVVALKGWREWLGVKRLELAARKSDGTGKSPALARVEVADLRERVRKLEAIASGEY